VRPARAHNFGTYFVTTQSWERRRLFVAERIADEVIAAIYRYRSQQDFLLHDFVLMPDHLHLLITPTDVTLERAMQWIKGGSSHAIGNVTPSLEVWQKGFTDHRIRDAADYDIHREYIRMNPVRARLSNAPEEYAYSSATAKYDLDGLPQRLKPLALSVGQRQR
jgi:putative transposase